IGAEEERPRDALLGSVLDDRLRDRRDVVVVERRIEARAAVARRTERDALLGYGDVGLARVVGVEQRSNVDEVGDQCWGAGACVHAHIMARRSVNWTARVGAPNVRNCDVSSPIAVAATDGTFSRRFDARPAL